MNATQLKTYLWTEAEIRAESFQQLNNPDWNHVRIFDSTLWTVHDEQGQLVPAPQPRPFFPSA